MSRTLSKILVICAMIAIIPLMIVGTAFAAYHSIGATMVVSVYTNIEDKPEGSFANVTFNGKSISKDENIKIEQSHLTKVKLEAKTNGYNFMGWFAGNAENYALAHAAGTVDFAYTTNVIEVKITESENYLAVFEIKEFDVEFSYKAQPEDENITTATPDTDDGDATVRHYDWGDEIQPLTYDKYDYQFMGWQIVGDETATIYTRATFETSEDITLTAVWRQANKISVKYHDEDGNLFEVGGEEEIYELQPHQLKDISEFVSAEAGREYYWVDAKGSRVTEVNSKDNVNVYLKSQVINYTSKINVGDATFNGETIVTFNIENTSAIEAWFDASRWVFEYDFHTFAGIKYNGKTYTEATDEFKAAIRQFITTNPQGSVNSLEMSVEIKKDFVSFITDSMEYRARDSYDTNFYSYDVYVINDDQTIRQLVPTMAKTGSSELKIEEFFGINSTVYADIEDIQTEVKLTSVTIMLDGTLSTYEVTESTTMNDLISMILKDRGSVTGATEFAVTKLIANFTAI